MKLVLKAVSAFTVILIVVVIGLALLSGNQPTNVNPQPTSTPTLSPPPTFALTASPEATSSSPPSIVITFSNWTGPLGHDVIMKITVLNNGYPSFNASKSMFYIVYGDSKYEFERSWTQTFGDWKDQDIPNGGTYSGEIAFNVVRVHAEELKLEYKDSILAYNIIYNKK